MYAASLFAPRRATSSRAAAYQANAVEIEVAGADPHRLVALLFEGYERAAAEAQGAMASGDIERKCSAMTRAIRIVDEGLRSHLNLKAGGELARDLNELYAYVVHRLTLANSRNDPEVVAECLRLMQPVREAWNSIGTAARSTR